jgi:hypothetical protein
MGAWGHIAFTCPLSRPGPAACPDVELKTWAARRRDRGGVQTAEPPAVRGRSYTHGVLNVKCRC